MLDTNFWNNKRVFITGHTGFKGSWLCLLLHHLGAKITGFALPPHGNPSLYNVAGVGDFVDSCFGDIRDIGALSGAFEKSQPEIVIHLAAQPLVLAGYQEPLETYSTNIMGAVNFLECVRKNNRVRSVLNVTTDKVYKNREWLWGYRENEILCGIDPYSNSKSCSELVTHAYKESFLSARGVSVSTARAGNVIGGGDFSDNRIIPDCVRSAYAGKKIIVRNPDSIRPYQHVLEPLFAYLLIAEKQYKDSRLADSYNVGPDEADTVSTGRLADIFCEAWGEGLSWETQDIVSAVHEAHCLRLDCAKIRNNIGWRPRWNLKTAVYKTVEWSRAFQKKENIQAVMMRQIEEFEQWGARHE